jgi:hypothetical protein
MKPELFISGLAVCLLVAGSPIQAQQCDNACMSALEGAHVSRSEIQRQCCTVETPNTTQTGKTCNYGPGVCDMGFPSPVGDRCICRSATGPALGRVVQESTSDWSYGVYWCTTSKDNEILGRKVVDILKTSGPKSVFIEPWPPEKNKDIHYRVSGLEVRHAQSHADQGEYVQALLSEGLSRTAKLVQVQKEIPNYVGIFVCD